MTPLFHIIQIRRINPVENIAVAVIAMGEGWHNYHHVFPWDYKAAEHGDYRYNMTTMLIDMFAKIGWAYDLKQPSKDVIRRTIEKYGEFSTCFWFSDEHFEFEYTSLLTIILSLINCCY